jgi:hypothetical protein
VAGAAVGASARRAVSHQPDQQAGFDLARTTQQWEEVTRLLRR